MFRVPDFTLSTHSPFVASTEVDWCSGSRTNCGTHRNAPAGSPDCPAQQPYWACSRLAAPAEARAQAAMLPSTILFTSGIVIDCMFFIAVIAALARKTQSAAG